MLIISKEFLRFAIILLLSHLVLAQQCQRDYQLVNDLQLINLTSPNYPDTYEPGTGCRYRITAPMDHVVVVNCLFEVFPNACDTEKFIISLDGDIELRDGENHCSSITLSRTSHFRSIVLAYDSIRSNTVRRGRFGCLVYARRQPCSCGWSVNTRITNGQPAGQYEFPSIVALVDTSSTQDVFCSGNIVGHTHILTAASCMNGHNNPSNIVAYAGNNYLSVGNESAFAALYGIRNIFIHPEFSPATLINDIAILVTSTPIEWSRGVGPICIPWLLPFESFPSVAVEAAGWGTTSFTGPKSDTLQKVQLRTMTNTNCQQQYNGTTIRSSQICAYDYLGMGQGICQFDSGGPIIMRSLRLTLLGIISFGQGCGIPYDVVVNTRITSYLGWIWSNTQFDVCVV